MFQCFHFKMKVFNIDIKPFQVQYHPDPVVLFRSNKNRGEEFTLCVIAGDGDTLSQQFFNFYINGL